MIYQTIIIGAGPAGLSAALYTGRGGLKTLLLAGSMPGGQAMQTMAVDNYPGSTAENFTGPQLIENLQAQVASFGVSTLNEVVLKVKKLPSEASKSHLFAVVTSKNTYQAQTIIIATGATRNKLGLPGETELIGRGLSFCATCDGPFFREKEVAVVGGGAAALDEALFLTNLASRVHLIHRRSEFRAPDTRQISQIHAHPKIEVHFNTEVRGYLSNDRGMLTGLALGDGSNLTVAGVFLAIGTHPNSEIFKDLTDIQIDQNDYIQTDQTQKNFKTTTHIPGIFVAGDVADPLYKQLVVAAASGTQAALDVQNYLQAL